MSSQKNPNPILYPPTIIGHITKNIADLFSSKIKEKDRIKVFYGCQLNGKPHLGTTISLMCAYALAEEFQEQFQKPASLVFGALENGPGEKREVDGILYQRMLCDVYRNGRSLADFHLETFIDLLTNLSNLSGISHSVEFYNELQAKPKARKTLLELVARQDEFVPILNPSDDRLRIRFKCPEPGCGYEEKHSRTLTILEHDPYKRLVLQSRCFEHGDYQIVLEENNNDFVDVNTMIRNVMKEAVIIDESQKDNYFPLIVKGGDWIHAAVLVSNALELLGYSFKERPDRIATPMIEDWSGAKFSKSVYVKSGTYDKLPQEYVSLDNFVSKFGEEGFRDLWEHVSSWVKDPKKFYRNYSLEYLKAIFDK